jgi:hypothetical protein
MTLGKISCRHNCNDSVRLNQAVLPRLSSLHSMQLTTYIRTTNMTVNFRSIAVATLTALAFLAVSTPAHANLEEIEIGRAYICSSVRGLDHFPGGPAIGCWIQDLRFGQRFYGNDKSKMTHITTKTFFKEVPTLIRGRVPGPKVLCIRFTSEEPKEESNCLWTTWNQINVIGGRVNIPDVNGRYERETSSAPAPTSTNAGKTLTIERAVVCKTEDELQKYLAHWEAEYENVKRQMDQHNVAMVLPDVKSSEWNRAAFGIDCLTIEAGAYTINHRDLPGFRQRHSGKPEVNEYHDTANVFKMGPRWYYCFPVSGKDDCYVNVPILQTVKSIR